jgi:hypothetical protein
MPVDDSSVPTMTTTDALAGELRGLRPRDARKGRSSSSKRHKKGRAQSRHAPKRGGRRSGSRE